MDTHPLPARRRGRPPRQRGATADARELLLRAGLEVLTEKGFTATGLDEILRQAQVPKGSFYHYFASKEAFGLALIDGYGKFFARKLDRHLRNPALSPLQRLHAFVQDAQSGMARFAYRRGCLIGNLGQEIRLLLEQVKAGVITVNEYRKIRNMDPIEGGDELKSAQPPAPAPAQAEDEQVPA